MSLVMLVVMILLMLVTSLMLLDASGGDGYTMMVMIGWNEERGESRASERGGKDTRHRCERVYPVPGV